MATAQKTVVFHDLKLDLDAAKTPMAALQASLKKRLGTGVAVDDITILRRALDARRGQVHYIYSVACRLEGHQAQRLLDKGKAHPYNVPQRPLWRLPKTFSGQRPIVVGAGPAGLFAALTLAEAGMQPVLIERGKAVQSRAKDVSALYGKGILDPESNVCYGEGGAGTFSDGKLYTRRNDPRVTLMLETLIELGAKEDIRINARPHIGTDRLVKLLANLRQRLLELGATIQFETKVVDFLSSDVAGKRQFKGVRLADGQTLNSDHIIVATGHSARDIWHALERAGVILESRPFAMGFRIEHPQALINAARYGRHGDRDDLPAAEYRLVHNDKGLDRSCYSFCMCPGGVVVPTPTEDEALCINGMSHASRSGRFANSAMVVTVGAKDFDAAGFKGVYAGVDFQEALERKAFAMGGGDFRAPSTNVADFLAGRSSTTSSSTSYRRGLAPQDLGLLLPQSITETLRHALRVFDRKMHGFGSKEGQLIALESRTASPIRVPRGDDHRALETQGLFVSGEGMGYGGGIASAAIDGIKTAEYLLASVGAVRDAHL